MPCINSCKHDEQFKKAITYIPAQIIVSNEVKWKVRINYQIDKDILKLYHLNLKVTDTSYAR